jgi:hypothetical protein
MNMQLQVRGSSAALNAKATKKPIKANRKSKTQIIGSINLQELNLEFSMAANTAAKLNPITGP